MAPPTPCSTCRSPGLGANLFSADRGLTGLCSGPASGGRGFERLALLGELAGTPAAQDWARLANSYPPVLRSHDRYGHRIDEVEFHPAWHELMTVAVANGLHATPWSGTAGRTRTWPGPPASTCGARWNKATSARSR